MFRLFGLMIFPFFVGCGFWSPMTEYTLAVFSDDDQGAAAVWQNFEGQDTITHLKKREIQVQVWLSRDNPSGTLEAFSEMQPGYEVDLFFMREAGYVILGRLVESEEPEEAADPSAVSATLFYDQIDLDGNTQEIARLKYFPFGDGDCGSGPQPLRVIPNADGSQLAKFEVTLSETCDDLQAQLLFLDATNLEALGDAIAVEGLFTAGSAIRGFQFSLGWTSDGGFAVAGEGDQSLPANIYRLNAEPELGVTLDRNCFHPPTTSSETNSNGQYLGVDSESGELEVSDESEPGHGFGCES